MPYRLLTPDERMQEDRLTSNFVRRHDYLQLLGLADDGVESFFRSARRAIRGLQTA